MRGLQIPPETEGDWKATEMIRVWLAHGQVHVSLLLGMWEDSKDSDVDERETWGTLLGDVARHIANGMKKSHGFKQSETLSQIRHAFLDNVSGPDWSEIEGDYLEEK